jgi:rhodanese-related sulfurtransferase
MDIEWNSIGKFQLENLRTHHLAILLFWLGDEVPAHSLLEGAQALGSDGVQVWLKENRIDLAHPIILVCSLGDESRALAFLLEEQGYLNVYWLQGGLPSLESEGD